MMNDLVSVPSSTTEQRLVAAFLADRAIYDLYSSLGERTDVGFTPIAAHVVQTVGSFYSRSPDARSCDAGHIVERVRAGGNPKHHERVQHFIASLPDRVSLIAVRDDILSHHRDRLADRLSLALANRSPEASALIKAYQALEENGLAGPVRAASAEEGLLSIFDTGDLLKAPEAQEGLIKVWPKALNDLLDGGARKGHQILIYGRPESGKTLVAMNMVVGFLKQKLSGLYVANEEPAADIRIRLRQRLLKCSKDTVRNEPLRVAKALEAKAADWGRLDIAPLAPGTLPQIRRLLDRTPYDFLVLDQLRNIKVDGEGRKVEALEAVATGARNLAKQVNVLCVSVTQAGDSASEKAVLELNDVDGSKTGIPAQMDLMVGVGNTKALWAQGMLTLSTPKNKIGGQHEAIQVTVNKMTGEVK